MLFARPTTKRPHVRNREAADAAGDAPSAIAAISTRAIRVDTFELPYSRLAVKPPQSMQQAIRSNSRPVWRRRPSQSGSPRSRARDDDSGDLSAHCGTQLPVHTAALPIVGTSQAQHPLWRFGRTRFGRSLASCPAVRASHSGRTNERRPNSVRPCSWGGGGPVDAHDRHPLSGWRERRCHTGPPLTGLRLRVAIGSRATWWRTSGPAHRRSGSRERRGRLL